MLDYKDVSFSFRDRTARRRRRALRLLLLALLALAALLFFRQLRARSLVTDVQDLLLAGRWAEAERRLQEAGSPFFQRANIRELRALADLHAGRLDAAAAKLAELRRDGAATSLRSTQILGSFFDQGRCREMKAYAEYLLPRGDDDTRWFAALGHSAFLNGPESQKALAGLSASFRKANAKAVDLLARFNRSLASGRLDYVLDRNDLPLAYFDLQRHEDRSLVPGIAFPEFAAQLGDGARFFRLTLDGGLQRKVDRLFARSHGTLVLLDLPDCGIAAAYSKPRSAARDNAAFSELFEPGSIVKLVSLLAYLRHGGPGVFPLECAGHFPVGRRIIYDLEKHGRVGDASQALALSCNVGFARMAQAAGASGLEELLRRFSFNAAGFQDGFCRFVSGKFVSPGSDAFRLASLAAGLDGVSMTTLHAAVLAAVIAQSGRLDPPYLIDGAKNILGLGFYRHAPRPRLLLADDLNFLRLRKAMAAVVDEEKGTGRRLRGAPCRLAIKTGTAPNPQGGLDAVIAGFFPLEKPRYAFAFRLEGGGRAEVGGADFLLGLLQVLEVH